MAARVYVNNISTRLTAAVAAGDLTINVTAGTGVNFAGATGGDWIIATLAKVSGYREIAWEIVKVTARATDALTIVRAQEGTAALTFAVGDVVDVRATAYSFGEVGATTPTPVPSAGAFTTASAVLKTTMIGNRVFFNCAITITNNGTGSGYITVPMPYTALEITGCSGVETGVNGWSLAAYMNGSNLVIRKYDGAYPGANGYVLSVAGHYRV